MSAACFQTAGVTQGIGPNPVWASCRELVVKEMRFINIFLTLLALSVIFSLKAALAPCNFSIRGYFCIMSVNQVYVVKCSPAINTSFPLCPYAEALVPCSNRCILQRAVDMSLRFSRQISFCSLPQGLPMWCNYLLSHHESARRGISIICTKTDVLMCLHHPPLARGKWHPSRLLL